MLVHAYSHLIPPPDGSPAAYSSSSTSTYIPEIPYSEMAPTYQPSLVGPAHRINGKRARNAPYPQPLSIDSQYHTRDQMPGQSLPLHSPRPIACFNPVHALDNNSSPDSPIDFIPGVHGSILNPFHPPPELSTKGPRFSGELTATQMACMPDEYSHMSELPPSVILPTGSYTLQTPQTSRTSNIQRRASYSKIRVPQVPSVPQLTHSQPPAPLSDRVPLLPGAIPPAFSEIHILLSDSIPPPAHTFPTPSELLNDLAVRDRERDAQQREHRRTERRKAQQAQIAKNLGYTPTDPDTISSHEKKRHYLDCLEQYVIFLHTQLRLVGVDPVPVERVSSSRGLTSRSIRTIIVHLKQATSEMHRQKKTAELKYDELRAQLGADADLAPPLRSTGLGGNRHGGAGSPTSANNNKANDIVASGTCEGTQSPNHPNGGGHDGLA